LVAIAAAKRGWESATLRVLSMKLTQSSIARLTLSGGKTDEIFFDDELPRFGIRLREGGSRKYVLHYRQAGIQRRHTIGSTATLTLQEARQRARKILVAIEDGRDPAAEKENKRAAAGLIFAAVADDYLEACQARLEPKTLDGYGHHLKNLWRPLHKLALSAVTRQVVASHLRTIAKDNGVVTANRARSTLSSMFAWAIGEGLCETNPIIGTNVNTEAPRERVLSDAELAAIWKAAKEDDYGRVIKLLTLTGQRREEIGGLHWSEIDMEAKLITLAGTRTKNGLKHEVPLSDAAMSILKTCAHHRDLVFGGGANGFAEWSRKKLALDKACNIKDWTIHDLRRTCATRMADLGVQPHVIEAILNHVSGHKAGVAGIYNRSTYAAEKRVALDLWGNHIRVILAQSEGANVHKLKRMKVPSI
jgi:integrase